MPIVENEVGEFAVELYDPNWTCGLTDLEEAREVQLAVYVEYLDTKDYDSEANEDYPYVVDAHIVVHPDSLTEEGIKYSKVPEADRVYIENLHHNFGGVPVKQKWCSGMNEDWLGIEYIEEDGEYKFASWDDAEKYVNKILKNRLQGLMGMIGFYLDEQINRIGSTGWDMIEGMVYGKNFIENALNKKMKEL